VRTLSYLLHPPFLDEMGLVSALRWYAEGFQERSRIRTEVECAGDFGRLPAEQELALFRVAKECLSNIHSHAGARQARLVLRHNGRWIELAVEDDGKGFPPDQPIQWGVGLASLRERLRQLGGQLTAVNLPKGARVSVTIPAGKGSP
jgi:two-component system, NarL family, sensor kinase